MDTKRIITQELKKYISRIRKEIPIEKAYLVGSWARGKAKNDSDVDLLVLSKAFDAMDFDKRLSVVYRNTDGIDFDLHIHPVTRAELEKASTLTSLGMMRVGKKIALI